MEKKKIIKIITIGLSAIMLAGITSSIAVKAINEKHVCKASTTLSYDTKTHFYKCKNNFCAERFSISNHDLYWVIDKEETCEENGYKHRQCDCGYKVNVGTVIDEFKYDANIQLQDNMVRNFYYNEWDDGNHSPTLELNLGKFDNERNNTSFTAHYQFATKLSNEYVYKNVYNDSVLFSYSGFSINDVNSETYNIKLSISPNSIVEYSLDIATTSNGTYRLYNEEVTALCKDYIKNGCLDVDFGVYQTENLGLVYGLRFKTLNNELMYLSDNSGNLKNETKVVKFLDSTTISYDNYTLNDVLSFIGTDGIYNKGESAITIMNRNWTGRDNYGTLVSCDKASVWLMNQVKYIEWQNS